MNRPLSHPLLPASEGRKTRAEHLLEAEARQPAEGINSPFCRASHAELARADADIGARLTCRPKCAAGWRLTPYGLEKVS